MALLLDTLSSVDILAGMSQDAVVRFMVLGRSADFRKNHVFWRAGASGQGIVVPVSGEAKLATRGTDGRVFPWGDAQPDPTRVNACGSECAAWHERVGLQAELHGVMYDADDGYTGTSPVGMFPAGKTTSLLSRMISRRCERKTSAF